MDIVVCFALFLAAMLFCLVKGFSLAWALLFALVLFFALGLRRGYGAKALVKMAWSKMPKSMIVPLDKLAEMRVKIEQDGTRENILCKKAADLMK